MNHVADRQHAKGVPASRQIAGRRADLDHDLPILAVEANPHVQLDWQSLIDDGFVPALFLGAERRSRGPR